MAYARKVLTKKENLRTYNNFFISLWSMFSFLFELYNWLDTAFDVYKENSIKTNQQRWKTTVQGIETIISGFDQLLPVEIDRLWSVSNNKSARQQLFTKWILKKVKSEQFDELLFLGGSHKENDARCVSFVTGLVSVERMMEYTHKEIANLAINVGNYGIVVIASPDTALFVPILHHFWGTLIGKNYGIMFFQFEEAPEHSSPSIILQMIWIRS